MPETTLKRAREAISTRAEKALEAHDLRMRHAGKMSFVGFHLAVSGEMAVLAPHGICDGIEQALREEGEHALVTIHVEPENKGERAGAVVLRTPRNHT